MALFGLPKRVFTYTCARQFGGCGLVTQVDVFQGMYSRAFTCPNCRKTITMNINLPAQGVALLPRQTLHAFGDESSFWGVIAYGVVAVHAHNVLAAERLLSGLKRRYGVDPQEAFHCTVVFHGDKRRESAWAHLSVDQVYDFAEELLSGFVSLPALFVVGAAHRSEQPTEHPAVGKWPRLEWGTKQLAGVLCGAALTRLNDLWRPNEIKFWADPDSTKIPFGWGRMQAHNLYYMNNSDTNQRIEPVSLDAQNKPPLLQVADLFAYTATHALSDKRHRFKDRFDRFYKVCHPSWSFMGYHDDNEIEFKPKPSRLESRHAQLMVASSRP
jgi:hypothetical protein